MGALRPSRAAWAAFCGPQRPVPSQGADQNQACVCVDTLGSLGALAPGTQRRRIDAAAAPHASRRDCAFPGAGLFPLHASRATLCAGRRLSRRAIGEGEEYSIITLVGTAPQVRPPRHGPFAGFATGAPATTPTRAQ